MAPEIPHGHHKALDQAILAQVTVDDFDLHLAAVGP
jgi:hypothetical protein